MFKKKADGPQASSAAGTHDVEEGSPASSPPAAVEPARAASASSQLADEGASPAAVAQSATARDGGVDNGVGGGVDSGDADEIAEIAELKRRIAELEAGQAAAG